MYFTVEKDDGGHDTWRLYGENHELVAWAGESFASAFNARRAAAAFKDDSNTARYETYPDEGGRYRWRAWRSSDRIAASGESFSDISTAERAATNVSLNAGDADL